MICNNCKNELEPTSAFCSFCGAKVSAPEASKAPEVPAVPETKDAAAPEIKAPAQEAPVIPQPQPPVREAMPLPVPPVNIAPPPPPVPYKEKKRKPEKEPAFFGKGALIACLIVIGILSCSTTVFATLFFTLLGRI